MSEEEVPYTTGAEGSELERLAAHIRDVPDFPKPGILFKDISPLLQDPTSLRSACRLMAEPFAHQRIDLVVGIESRGFIFGAPVALALGTGFALARKLGKLPWDTRRESYALEYGSADIEMHSDSVKRGQRVLVVDDVIATGGTAAATVRLVRALGGEVVAASFLIELGFLAGRKALDGLRVEAVLRFYDPASAQLRHYIRVSAMPNLWEGCGVAARPAHGRGPWRESSSSTTRAAARAASKRASRTAGPSCG